jgi:putative ABC transport system permease protein
MLERLLHDIRYAARSLRRSPGFTVTAAVVLALGVGANTAVFSVGRRVLLEPLPYSEPDRLVQLLSHTPTGLSALASVPKLNEWRDRIGPGTYRAIAAYYASGPGVTLTRGARQQHLEAMYVTASYFEVFAAPVGLGRAFTPAEDVPQGPRVVVISHGLAQREFGSTRIPIGEMISFGNEAYEIVGVMSASFRSIPAVDVWLPLQAPRVSFNHTNYLTIVGRLRPGVSIESAARQSLNVSPSFRQKFPWAMGPGEWFAVEPLGKMVAGNTQAALRVLAAAVGFVLLIACANVANLFAARAARRQGEIATRAALGASRVRLVRQLFSECVLLALAGGLLGLVCGYSGVRALLVASPGGMPPIASVAPDGQVLAFTLAVSVATAILFGVLPVLTASRVDLSTTMKDSAGQAATGTRQHRRQSTLVVLEIMLALVLLVGAGLMLKTFAAIRSVDRGFDASDVLTVQMPLNDVRFQHGDSVSALVRNTERHIETVAGAQSVAATYSLPLDPTISIPFTLLDRSLMQGPYHGVGSWHAVSPQFFDVFRIRLNKGRRFTDLDDGAAERVVIINQSMARRFWQHGDPVGERLLIGKSADREFDEPPRRIIGVVANVRDMGANSNPEPAMYVPLAQTSDRMIARNNRFLPMTWIVRTTTDPMAFRAQVERELTSASGGLPIARSRSMAAVVRAATAQLEFTTILLSIFAAAALLLAAVGLYGLMSYSVEQRAQEIGIRIALGAGPGGVRNMILWQGGRLTTAGVLLGLGTAFGLSRVMSSAIFGIATWDPAVFAAVAALLAAVSISAAYVPALAATRVDPVRTLRR